MLIRVFEEFNKKYHTSFKDGVWHIASDCPPDLVEELRVVDAKFFEEQGYHLYDNFMDEDSSTESTT